MDIRISCLPVSLFNPIIEGKISISDWIDYAKECNLDGVDISIMFLANHTPVYLRKLKEMLLEKNFPIVMCTSYPDFTHYSKIQRHRELDYFKRDIALCSEIGIPYLRILAGQAHKETSVDKGIEWAIEYIRKSALTAEEYGVTLLYENHGKPGAWDYIDLTFPLQLFLRVVEGIWDTGIKINIDIGNITAYGEEPLCIISKVYPKIETVHVSDMASKGVFAPVAIGSGVVPLKETLRYFKNKHFKGWLCIEEASNQGLPGIKKAVQTVRDLWNTV